MQRDPSDIHFYEQLHARAIDIARVVAAYRRELIDGGVSDIEAWESARLLERRLWDAEIMPPVWFTDEPPA